MVYAMPGLPQPVYDEPPAVYDDESAGYEDSISDPAPTTTAARPKDRLPSVSVRSYFPETWLWDLVTVEYVCRLSPL